MRRLGVLGVLAGVMIVSSIALASAKKYNGVSFSEQIQVAGAALTLNGLGLRQATILRVNVYVAARYVAKASGDAAAILSAPGPLRARIDRLKAAMGDTRKGQRLTFTHRPGAGIQVDVNGTLKATIEGDDFAKAFVHLAGRPPTEREPEVRPPRGACG